MATVESLKRVNEDEKATQNYNIWKADFSLFRYQKVKPKMAEIEAILGRHFQSPNPRGQCFYPGVMLCNPRVFCGFFHFEGGSIQFSKN